MSLVPDFYFEKFNMASAEFLKSIGVRGILLDVDNTLEPYENSKPSDEVKNWLSNLREVGIKAAIVSNNGKRRVNLFNEELGLKAYSRAAKPFKRCLVLAMKEIGTTPQDTIFMGDQIFTDIFAARCAGMRSILVKPIKDKRDIFTKFKRLLEKPIINRYFRMENK